MKPGECASRSATPYARMDKLTDAALKGSGVDLQKVTILYEE